MTNIDDILASIAPETNSTDELDHLLYKSRVIDRDSLTPTDIRRIIDKTMSMGRYGAQCRNVLRTYYSF